MMKKIACISLFALMAASAPALNFFGIEYSEDSANCLANLLYSLAQGNSEEAQAQYDQLKQASPSLAAAVKLDELKIPCARCRGEGTTVSGGRCSTCEGSKVVTDAQSLGYLHYKLFEGLDSGKQSKAAWNKAIASFDKRRALVLAMEPILGTLIRAEEDGLLIYRRHNQETIYVKGLQLTVSNEGAPVNGAVWPNGTHTYLSDDGTSIEIKCYTANLWID